MCDAGLCDAHLSIHGARADVHDFHTGRDGSFVAATATALGLRARGVTVVATTVLTRSNFRVLGELPALAAAGDRSLDGGAAALRAAARPQRSIGCCRGSRWPRFALHAIDRAQRLGLPVAITGAPLCLLGPFAGLARHDAARASRLRAHDAPPAIAAPASMRSTSRAFSATSCTRARPSPRKRPCPPRSRACSWGSATSRPRPRPRRSPARALPIAQRPLPGRDETRTREPSDAKPLFPALLEPPEPEPPEPDEPADG
ncbi:MAG: hypothetical protein U0168_01980 [Nannocystaceae bacterium]